METLSRDGASTIVRVADRAAASPPRSALGALGRGLVSASICALALGVAGCGAGVDELRKEVAAMHTELTGVRADNAALSERVDALEIAHGGLKGYKDSSSSGGAGSDRPEDLQVVKLGPSPGGDDSGRTVLRSGAGGVVQEDAKPDEQGSSAAGDFAKAKELLDKKSYGDALSAFSAFLVRFPDSPRVADATYYRGVCYAAKNDPRHAAEQFEAVLASSPKSDKAAEALEALAKAYDKLGDKASADRAKKRLKAEYPKSSGAKKTD